MKEKIMSAVLRPVQMVPEIVKEQTEKHPRIYFWSIISTIIVVLFSVLHFFTIKQTELLQVKNDALSLDVENLKLFQSQQSRILQLEQVFLTNKSIRDKIGQDNIAAFSFKVLTLADQYSDDGITAPLLLGLIEVESNFNPKATSATGAYGLLQVLRSTATPYLRAKGRDWSEAVMFDPIINIQIGTEYLVDLHRIYLARGMEKKSEFIFSLAAYNMGEGTVKSAVDKRDKIYLNYPVAVKISERKWSRLGI